MKKRINESNLALLLAEVIRDGSTNQGRIPFFTGDLRKSLQTELTGKGRAAIYSNLAYARAVHDGRPAITIRPNVRKNPHFGKRKHRDRRRARLKFKIGGKTVFAREVHQKARAGRPFIIEAIEEQEREGWPKVESWLKKQVEESLAEDVGKGIEVVVKF